VCVCVCVCVCVGGCRWRVAPHSGLSVNMNIPTLLTFFGLVQDVSFTGTLRNCVSLSLEHSLSDWVPFPTSYHQSFQGLETGGILLSAGLYREFQKELYKFESL
jgi:hypothetical protein